MLLEYRPNLKHTHSDRFHPEIAVDLLKHQLNSHFATATATALSKWMARSQRPPVSQALIPMLQPLQTGI